MLAQDGFPLVIGLQHVDGSWPAFCDAWRSWRRGIDLPEGNVPATFLLAEVDGAVVGRVSVRFELNDWLLAYGGHIGYGVVPAFRRRGFATEMLRQGLVVARAEGVERCLLTCDDRNVGSAAVIESCGGVLEDVIPDEAGDPMRRYWID